MVSPNIQYAILGAVSTLPCLYVMISYARNRSRRKPPAGLMLSKTVTDFMFAICFFVMMLAVETDENVVDDDVTLDCGILGRGFIFSWIVSQLYFTVISYDLFRTLSNPFRRPNAGSWKRHILVICTAGIMIAVVTPFHIFRYRKQLGICYTCNTGPKFNYYNLFLLYLPMMCSNLSGLFITGYSIQRLSKGLQKTFELRRLVIRRQFILIACQGVSSLVAAILWVTLIFGFQDYAGLQSGAYHCMVPDPSYAELSEAPKDSPIIRRSRLLLCCLILLNSTADGVSWYLTHRFTSSPMDKVIAKSKKTPALADGDSLLMGRNEREQSDTDRRQYGNKSRGGTETDADRDDLGDGDDDEAEKVTQNVSNALRAEIITYMTAGLEQCIYNTANATFKLQQFEMQGRRTASWTASQDTIQLIGDADFDDGAELDEEDEAGDRSRKTTMQRLDCVEPVPQRARYPKDIDDDPSSHPDVINQIWINLHTKNIKSMYKRLTQKFVATSGGAALLDDHMHDDASDEEKEEEKQEEEEGNDMTTVHIYESGKSDVELMRQSTKGSSQAPQNETIVDDDDDDDDVDKTAAAAIANVGNIQHLPSGPSVGEQVLGSITRTFSRVASTLTANETDTAVEESPETAYAVCTNTDNEDGNGVPFKDYAPHCFRYLRQQIYGISDAEYAASVRPPDHEEQTKLIQEKFSEGRSGAFFFFTHDNKYIIKTVTNSEATLLLRILPDLVRHYADNRNSLINRFFGLHSITMYNLNLYFVVLENIFVANNKPHEMYDLKGSYVDRHTNHHVESGKLMKDQDLKKTLKLIPSIAHQMYQQLRVDSKFLARHNIMDYSVLLGIYYVGIDPADIRRDRIMLNHHDNASQLGNRYVPPVQEEEIQLQRGGTDETDADAEHKGQSLHGIPDDLFMEERRPRAPSFNTGMDKFAQQQKAVRARVIEGPGIYYIGIIDVLQEWNANKKLERLAKVYCRMKPRAGISCVEPVTYRRRFLRKMYQIGIKPQQKR